MTDCHSSEIQCSCYQLRVHDSKDVKFDIWARSVPIIEDCTGMKYFGNYYSGGARGGGYNHGTCGNCMDCAVVVRRNMFWDIKDLNWLCMLRKHPNFFHGGYVHCGCWQGCLHGQTASQYYWHHFGWRMCRSKYLGDWRRIKGGYVDEAKLDPYAYYLIIRRRASSGRIPGGWHTL